MFAIARRMKSPKKNTPAALMDTQGEAARIAIAENGEIMYASEAFHALSDMDADKTQGAHAHAVLSFIEHNHDINTLPAGAHKVLVGRGHEPIIFHFDWLETPDKKRYLVGSHAQNMASSQSHMAPAAAPTSAIAPQNKEDLSQLAQISHDLMVVTDAQGAILSANPAFLSTLGYHEDSIAGTILTDLFDGADIQGTSFPQNFESRIISKNSAPRWIEWQHSQANNKHYYCGRDISDIKDQQSAIARREKQLCEAESIGRMGHWTWVIGQEEIEWSDEIFRIFGVTRDEFKPTMRSMNAMVHSHDSDLVDHALQRAIISQNDFDVEFRILLPSGEKRHIRCEGRCALDDEGEATELYGIMQDMTERTIYEQQLKEAKNAAERAYSAKSQFLANMSHELRTPLNAIIGFSEMMSGQLLGPIGTEKYLEYVDSIRDSGAHLLDLISDILDMSKIEAGKYELALEEISPATIISRAVNMTESRALDQNIKLSISALPEEDLKIVADRRAILQIALNLLSNAIKFSKDDGTVEVSCTQEGDNILLTIRDEGIGIPANKLANITRPFEQVSTSYTRDHEGSGLGLSITKNLVELHGGHLKITSQVDIGTTVSVKLPLRAQY